MLSSFPVRGRVPKLVCRIRLGAARGRGLCWPGREPALLSGLRPTRLLRLHNLVLLQRPFLSLPSRLDVMQQAEPLAAAGRDQRRSRTPFIKRTDHHQQAPQPAPQPAAAASSPSPSLSPSPTEPQGATPTARALVPDGVDALRRLAERADVVTVRSTIEASATAGTRSVATSILLSPSFAHLPAALRIVATWPLGLSGPRAPADKELTEYSRLRLRVSCLDLPVGAARLPPSVRPPSYSSPPCHQSLLACDCTHGRLRPQSCRLRSLTPPFAHSLLPCPITLLPSTLCAHRLIRLSSFLSPVICSRRTHRRWCPCRRSRRPLGCRRLVVVRDSSPEPRSTQA
jgi:hypothetical protein